MWVPVGLALTSRTQSADPELFGRAGIWILAVQLRNLHGGTSQLLIHGRKCHQEPPNQKEFSGGEGQTRQVTPGPGPVPGPGCPEQAPALLRYTGPSWSAHSAGRPGSWPRKGEKVLPRWPNVVDGGSESY